MLREPFSSLTFHDGAVWSVHTFTSTGTCTCCTALVANRFRLGNLGSFRRLCCIKHVRVMQIHTLYMFTALSVSLSSQKVAWPSQRSCFGKIIDFNPQVPVGRFRPMLTVHTKIEHRASLVHRRCLIFCTETLQ